MLSLSYKGLIKIGKLHFDHPNSFRNLYLTFSGYIEKGLTVDFNEMTK